jgi:hypothetical protein
MCRHHELATALWTVMTKSRARRHQCGGGKLSNSDQGNDEIRFGTKFALQGKHELVSNE